MYCVCYLEVRWLHTRFYTDPISPLQEEGGLDDVTWFPARPMADACQEIITVDHALFLKVVHNNREVGLLSKSAITEIAWHWPTQPRRLLQAGFWACQIEAKNVRFLWKRLADLGATGESLAKGRRIVMRELTSKYLPPSFLSCCPGHDWQLLCKVARFWFVLHKTSHNFLFSKIDPVAYCTQPPAA